MQIRCFWLQDMNKMTPDKIEIATLRRVNGKTIISIMENEEMSLLIKKFEDAEKAAEEAKREKEFQAKGDGKPWRPETGLICSNALCDVDIRF